jgi:hypothetical protein
VGHAHGAIIENVSWERELHVITEALRRLNAEYDAFLFGSVSRPPTESRRHVEEMFRRLTQSVPDSAADRYRFSSLQGRFYSLCERWEKLQAEKEAGRRPGIHGGFAAHVAELPAVPNARPSGSVEPDRRAVEPSSSGDRALFERYVAARRGLGEEVAGFGLDSFLARLAEERRKLRERLGVTEVDFDVVERDGRVKLIARPGGAGSKVRNPNSGT